MNPRLGLRSAGDRDLLVVVCPVVLIPGDTLAYMPTLSLEEASEPRSLQRGNTQEAGVFWRSGRRGVGRALFRHRPEQRHTKGR
jgi:hypothetical protein